MTILIALADLFKHLFDKLPSHLFYEPTPEPQPLSQPLSLMAPGVPQEPSPALQPVSTPTPVTEPPRPQIQPSNTLLWDTPANARHSLRVICDEEGLTLEQKNTLCATVTVESGFHIHATHPNYAFHGGVKQLMSTDWGICQWNDWYHSKEITPEEAMNNPEKAVRLMCAYWKRGQRNQWVAYSSGLFKHYL